MRCLSGPPGPARGQALDGGRSAVGTLLLECALCDAIGPLCILGDDLGDLTADAAGHLARCHPGALHEALVMHQRAAWGAGPPDQVASAVRVWRPAIEPALTD